MSHLISRLFAPKQRFGSASDHSAEIAEVDQLLAHGNELEASGQYAAALELYESAARTAPAYPRAYMNIGNALQQLHRFDEAAESYREAIRIAPDYAPARFNLGSFLASHGDNEAGEIQLREALRIEPRLVEAAVVMSIIMEATGRPAEAENILRRALELRPDFAPAALNLGQLLLGQERFDDAISFIERSVAIVPDALSWMLFSLTNRTDLNVFEIYRRHLSVGDAILRISGPSFTTWSNHPDPNKQIKVGYVSGDFQLHPVGLFLKPVLAHHNRTTFDVHCFSNSAVIDPATQILRQFVPNWHPISNLSNNQVADLFRNEGIDILVDLSGHTNHNRLAVFARHPAPVQITWLGYLNTTGLSAMDYRICDRYTDPAGVSDELHTEKLFRLPHSQWCYEPWFAPAHYSRAASQSERIVFGSVNSSRKITTECLELWCRILDAVPSAELVILDVPERNRQPLLEQFARHNIAPSRLSIRERQSLEAYYCTIGDLDIALDTFPYNGATTTLNTLWMGTPIVAFPGDRGISRGSYSILSSVQLPELIARTAAEYVEINVRLARDHAWRSNLRASLRPRLAASPLMDAAGFVADLEAAYRQMWLNWCKSQSGG
jgi:predicted O-linked N-acetylglucosamine transferase (SPINDLY family)